ncbi:histidine phosphotransferase family protein [Dongia soli]|uniref:Histidine phosphotransferase family protein n=1 Tax=Dongia soli TaxID=600628 RepID=A0ABU5E8S9_9PROT|nr:histidine phosphotransferase family protein [Dongia soli]MDY0882623.1 histidine phosphotransferase family protein [Dongia soli]
MEIDLRVLELAASKICHDLISPIGAVNNGLELMEEEQDHALQAEALALAQRSARRASILLQLYRSLFGNAGNQTSFGPREAVQMAFESLQGGKVALEADLAGASPVLPEGYGKLILAAVVVAADTLPRGGTVLLRLLPGQSAPNLLLTSTGAQIAAHDEILQALHLRSLVEELSAHTVLPYFTAFLARRLGLVCHAETPQIGQFTLSISA